jgi:ABC-type amino acid transport substrate-binding protein
MLRIVGAVAVMALSASGSLGVSEAQARTLEAVRARGSLTVCANPNALPFSSKNGSRRGFELELADALAKELGVGLEVGWVVFPSQMGRVDCDVVFDAIADPQVAEEAHLRLSTPYNVSGVAIALRPGLAGIAGFADLKKEQRIGALVGALVRVRLDQKGIGTIPFTTEDELIEAVGNGELDAGLVTPASIGYYNLLHKDAAVSMVLAYETTPELRWNIAVGLRKADDALVTAINQALDHLLAQGTVKQIYASYGVEQLAPSAR